ncbi:vWA domain-containing protein [Actinophytocola sediminis]
MGRRGLVVGVLAVWLAMAVPAPAAVAAQPPAEEAVQGSMMFVLDASGSMVDRLPAGGTKMDAAKAAMTTLVDGLPVNLHVGLAAYGTSTGASPAEKAAGCQDVRVLAPVGRADKEAMLAQIAGITPRGYTPIGRSLEEAAAALPDSGPRAIVLVSDGIDTCAPPAPCEVAAELAGAGVELAVHAIGFQVDPAAREQLECIATETGGEYHDAPDAEVLADLLPEIADRALRHYEVDGESVDGAASMADAEYLVPGQYADEIERRTPNYYQVHVPAGATGQFTVVHTVESGSERWDSGVGLRLLDGAERVCAENEGFREFSYDGPETASLSWTAVENSRCDPAGPHYLEVTWDNLLTNDSDDIELSVAVEPAASGGVGSPAEEAVEFSPPDTGQDIVWGGGSFNDAAALPGTGRYLDRIHYSEYSVYKVWLDWGQSLACQVTFADSAETGRATAVTELRSPARAGMREHWWRSTDYTGTSVAIEPVATPEISYANRDGKYPRAAHDGWYYLVVKLSPVWTEGTAVPDEQPSFEIALTVSGSDSGGPEYAQLSVPTSAPPSVSSTWTPSATVSATDIGLLAADSAFPWWVLAMVGGVVLFGGFVVLVLRRRDVSRDR